MKLRRSILWPLIITSLFGCATSEKYGKLLDTWLGESEEALVTAWGPPQNLYISPTGTRVLTYVSQSQVLLPGTTGPSTTYVSGYQYGGYFSGTATTYNYSTPPTLLNYNCTTNFTINKGHIVNWQYKGNNCVSNYNGGSIKINTKETQIIDTSPVDDSIARKTSFGIVYVKFEKVDVRLRPGLNEEVVDTVGTSTPLAALEETDYWVKVRTTSDKEGWVAKTWLQNLDN